MAYELIITSYPENKQEEGKVKVIGITDDICYIVPPQGYEVAYYYMSLNGVPNKKIDLRFIKSWGQQIIVIWRSPAGMGLEIFGKPKE